MRVGTARSAAVQWVAEHARPDPWFRGAYFSGSTVGLPDGAELSPFSDVDVVVVTAEPDPPAKPGKFRFRDALLEVSHLSWDELASADEVLSSYHLAGSFRRDTVIDDPTGRLRELRADVSRRFAERPWVRRRCLDAERRIETRLGAFDASAPFHEQVMSWLFPTGVTTHVLLVAALRNPTVRLRYPAAREVLDAYGQAHLYPELLELLGCARLSARRAGRHLDELAHTFDAAAEVARTPFFFSGDITTEARPVAIDGSRHLIERATTAKPCSGSSRPSRDVTPYWPRTPPSCTAHSSRPSGRPSPISASRPPRTFSAGARRSSPSSPNYGGPPGRS